MDKFHLLCDIILRVAGLQSAAAFIKREMENKLIDQKAYIELHGEDMPEICNWKWNENTGE